VPKLSSVRTMLEASFATSVPLIPIATPMSARLSAGPSLTPSPVTATISPSSFNVFVSLSLCWGLTLANMISFSLSLKRALSFLSDILLRSSPVIISWFFPVMRPICFAIASAVSPWSPVTTYVRMPASFVKDIAVLTSRLGGSIIPASPRKIRLFSVAASV